MPAPNQRGRLDDAVLASTPRMPGAADVAAILGAARG